MKMKKIDKMLKTLDKLEEFVYLNEDSFINEFCDESGALVTVCFHSEGLFFNFVAPTGETYVDSADIDEFKDWMIKVKHSE